MPQVGVWVLGEYAYLLGSLEQDSVMELMCALLERENLTDPSTKCFVITAVTKLMAQGGGNVEVPAAIKRCG
jgi:hypothetical protein